MCECYNIDHPGFDPACPLHGINGIYQRESESEAAFERWWLTQEQQSQVPISEEHRAVLNIFRKVSWNAWQAAISYMADA
jgi:hypothetical protein